MLERFAREKQKTHKKNSMFDLEYDEPEAALTHGGKSLLFDEDKLVDDFDEDDIEDDSDGSTRERQRLKRLRDIASSEDHDESEKNDAMEQPVRKKTKKEVMEEIIAKSKLHKMERQAAKEEDEDIRAEIDKELPNIRALLSIHDDGSKRHSEATAATLIGGVDRDAFERNFDLEVKRLGQDKRAQPADRTKTEEEKAEEESRRLRELEDRRQRRMRGEDVPGSGDDDDGPDEEDGMKNAAQTATKDHDEENDTFGLGTGIKARSPAVLASLEDEDDFFIEDDLIASGSDLEPVTSDESEGMSEQGAGEHDEEQQDFIQGLLTVEEAMNPVFQKDSAAKQARLEAGDEHGLPFVFPCPQSLSEFLDLAGSYPSEKLPTIIQRIRALYHPKLDSKNKERMARFSEALVSYIDCSCTSGDPPSFETLESLIRHVHSLAKSYAGEIANCICSSLEEMSRQRPLNPSTADLVLLSAISTIFPTSDHFHQVVTPAMLVIARYLGAKVPQKLGDYATGSYFCILALQYLRFSKRYVPELINFTLNTIYCLSPIKAKGQLGNFPYHAPLADVQIRNAKSARCRRLNFFDCSAETLEEPDVSIVKISVLDTSLKILGEAADMWSGKSSFIETFEKTIDILKHVASSACRVHLPDGSLAAIDKLRGKLEKMIKVAQLSRRPLELHHHRPLAIKTFIPKFEETFDPDKHYDPDRERAELAKLKAEHKKERKGAIRELRKDASFMAREKLKLKKAKDAAYEKKYKRLVADIQSEEGREANAYEREKDARKRARNR